MDEKTKKTIRENMPWKNCLECAYFYKPNNGCYRIQGEIMRVEDPSVLPDDCPSVGRGLTRHEKFPYFEDTCKGCEGDQVNHALRCDECQNYIVRPSSEKVGPCPYHGISFEDARDYLDKVNGWGAMQIPSVSERMAEIIVHGINDGDMSYWNVPHYGRYQFQLGYGDYDRILCRRICLEKSLRTGLTDVRISHVGGYLTVSMSVNRASISRNRSGDQLVLYRDPAEFENGIRIPISEEPLFFGKAPVITEDDDYEDEEEEECPCVKEEPTGIKCSLEEWM